MKKVSIKDLEKASNHFIKLYADELESVKPDHIYEWYNNSLDQFGHINYEQLEIRIFEKINNA